MEKNLCKITMEQFQDVIEVFEPTMDDYLYILDIKNDYYCISNSAVERFDLPKSRFDNAGKYIANVTYPDDLELIAKDLEQIRNHGKRFHNLQYRWRNKEGKPLWINCRGCVIDAEDGTPAFLVGCINEIGVRQKADNISGLLREESMQSELSIYGGENMNGFLIRLGIDNFKEINENKGIEYGDMVIEKTAACIQKALCQGQKLYRVVADEYLIVDLHARTVEDAVKLYYRIQQNINLFIKEQGYEVFYTISAGVVDLSHVADKDYHNLMKLSEFAMNEAKNTGKNKCYIYQKKDYHEFLRKRELTSRLLWSVNHNFEGFEAYFQPIMDIKEGELRNAETLLRFQSEQTGAISPVEFIPLLEESNLIIPVGKWVLEQAMAACSKIREKYPDFRVSVNLSYIQVLKSDVLSEILQSLEKYQLPPESIIIELTESGFLESNTFFFNFCNGLKENGIALALDDFGTGYSNFHYLYNLNLNTIKIDRSFTLKALKNSYEYNLLRHMSDMVHDVNLKLCIEGIETEEELERISEVKPDYIQGYYFGKPCSFQQFWEQFVQDN